MSIARKVDATPLCPRELDLFSDEYNAWDHLDKHVLDARESWSWGVLIPALQAALDAGQRADLHDQARNAAPDKVPADLVGIWPAFLELVALAAEWGVRQDWYWEEAPNPGDAPYKVFASSGILTCLDEDRVRTGFLPFKGNLPTGLTSEHERRYELFAACWKKVRFLYRRSQQTGLLVRAPASMQDLMRSVPSQSAWEALP